MRGNGNVEPASRRLFAEGCSEGRTCRPSRSGDRDALSAKGRRYEGKALLRPLEGHLHLSFIPALSGVVGDIQAIDEGVVIRYLVVFADQDTWRF